MSIARTTFFIASMPPEQAKTHAKTPPASSQSKVQEELDRGANLSIIELCNRLVECAYHASASDIHIDPGQDAAKVRLRIDGVLRDVFELPLRVHGEVLMRIKILANLRTDEHQAAQDGRFRRDLEGAGQVDVRVSVIPSYYGESAVLRLLADKSEQFTLESLGFNPENAEKVLQAIKKPYGMILATGPTGSGKTTTLYVALKLLNTRAASIITIEDPIEYAIQGIKQIQVNPRTALSFAAGLRSILRQDPNIIMVGEIRDTETASLAVNTALTGHLLLSTLHTNDAATTLPRLLDMHVEPFLIASTVNVAVGQRLVRKICGNCKGERELSAAEYKSLVASFPKKVIDGGEHVFFRGKGCKACNQTGYEGRIGIHEVLVVDDPIREAVLTKASAAKLKQIAVSQGMVTMVEDGFEKARQGITTIEEVLRVIHA